jgi:hypothetical protein
MSLTWRDVVGTVLVAIAVGATLSIVYGWNSPLLGDARAAGVALFALSYPSCLIAQAPGRMRQAIEGGSRWSGYLVTATVLGSVTVLLIVLDLIVNSVAVLVAATLVMALVWLVATIDHAMGHTGRAIASAA